jgi:hypothetical protein
MVDTVMLSLAGTDTVCGQANIWEYGPLRKSSFSGGIYLAVIRRSDLSSSRSSEDGPGRSRYGYQERATAEIRRSSEVAICRCSVQGSYKVEAGRPTW